MSGARLLKPACFDKQQFAKHDCLMQKGKNLQELSKTAREECHICMDELTPVHTKSDALDLSARLVAQARKV